MAVGKDREHGGNDGYTDDPSTVYRWDSTVQNHAAVSPGDRIALWDKHVLLGASVIEDVRVGTAVKALHRCPHCGKAGIKARRTKSPRYKCYKCLGIFDTPKTVEVDVTTYESIHDVAWTDLMGTLTGADLRPLCYSPKSQLSMRPLRWSAFDAAIRTIGLGLNFDSIESATRRLGEGHRERTVRVRVGQAAFRQSLMKEFGSVCALTGPTPPTALEAGHLYSYAGIGRHYDGGGLLLRRDLHRLFDLGLVAVNPSTNRIDVAPELGEYPAYADLDGSPLKVSVGDSHLEWFAAHWAQHRRQGSVVAAGGFVEAQAAQPSASGVRSARRLPPGDR
ncbi:HNH endonuclease [Intrasporangium calvum]|uniref:HNH endonuclease n=1 Tax=Intrasporangium calvum TaxID=53358 RepID=UPI003B5896F5